jgi:hypothetical protein
VIVCWEVTLSKDQEWDWLSDPPWRVQTLVILFIVGLAGLIFLELRHPSPVVNLRPFRYRDFAACRMSSSFAPTRCCMLPAPRCLPCCRRCSAMMP